MTRTLHLISGLPRSGSSLLAGLLRQNPGLHAAVQSPLADLIFSIVKSLSIHESALFVSDDQRRRILQSVLSSYYEHLDQDVVAFDTGRTWTSLLPCLADIAPRARVICCVRSPAWILDSVERLVQRQSVRLPRMLGENARTVFSRVDALMKGMVGSSLGSLKQAWYGEFAAQLIVVPYDSLVERPRVIMNTLYELLELPRFEHDFDRVEYDEPAFDAELGLKDLHRVSGPVRAERRMTVLPPEIFAQYDQDFWSEVTSNPRKVTVL